MKFNLLLSIQNALRNIIPSWSLMWFGLTLHTVCPKVPLLHHRIKLFVLFFLTLFSFLMIPEVTNTGRSQVEKGE